MMRRAAWVLLAVVVAGAIAWAAWPDGGARTDRERARDLAAELRCPDCEGLSVADSSSSSAQAIRADLRRRIRAGRSDESIRQGYVDRFGESILLNPEGEGLGVLVWGLPVLVLVVGAGGLVLALRRWQRQPAMHATAADEELVQRVRETERAASEAAEHERAAAGGVSPPAASEAMGEE
jgi:cytochrome c-type biogenesis protein CcmH